MVPSIEAFKSLKAAKQICSWDAGWRSLLLRGYRDNPSEEEFTTAATPDQLFVLVVDGSCQIESQLKGCWHADTYGVGSLAMTAPGETARVRWKSHEPHDTLQLHLPWSIISRQVEELWNRDSELVSLPTVLSAHDPLIEAAMIALREGLTQGLPDLYAETAAEFLSAHFLLRHCNFRPTVGLRSDDPRLQRAEKYMQENLSEPISLAALAKEAGLSRFHVLRLFKRAYGETPLKRLTRMRMEEAKRRLLLGRQSITEIALDCGYENSAHFATAFRRTEGVSPSAFRHANNAVLRS